MNAWQIVMSVVLLKYEMPKPFDNVIEFWQVKWIFGISLFISTWVVLNQMSNWVVVDGDLLLLLLMMILMLLLL